MDNPFDQINSELKEIKKLLKERPETPSIKNGVDLFRFMPVKWIFKNICSESTFYAHVRQGHFTIHKFGNLTFVDREEFEKAFHQVKRLKKVA